ncbi:hypothetical protein A9Q83_12270 [Alphaproteobacteria bacterium 46_93_T64]|nr:hypothetical protein A9Q83_12270 [Alphaproteobacteria bacterium 46_93_T64]
MPGTKQTKVKLEDERSSLEILLDSPVRVITLCAAILLFSLMTGMFVGGFIKNENPDEQTTAMDTKNDVRSGKIQTAEREVTVLEREEILTETKNDPSSNPVDALEYDPSDYRLAPTGSVVVEMTPDKDVEIAALPPSEIISKTVNKTELPKWQKYAAAFPVLTGNPVIAMVIDDVGLNTKRVQDLIALPAPLTLSFLPYGKRLKEFSDLTRERGHEVMLHLPMEPSRASADPGPDALLQALSADEIRRRTLKNLAQFTGYVGVNNHMGSKFTAYEPGMKVVMDILASEGLLFLDSRTTAKSKGYQLAKERKMPTGNRDVFIDNEISVSAINQQLAKVEQQARKKGIAIAIGHPYPETIEALAKWIPQAKKNGFQFIPVTAALSRKVAKRN